MLRLSQIGTLVGLKRHAINARAKTSFKNEELTRNTGNQILLKPEQVRRLISDRIDDVKGKVIYGMNYISGCKTS